MKNSNNNKIIKQQNNKKKEKTRTKRSTPNNSNNNNMNMKKNETPNPKNKFTKFSILLNVNTWKKWRKKNLNFSREEQRIFDIHFLRYFFVYISIDIYK